ncbi:actin family protein [Phanerochaete sordida]|uniref:Actin-like protein ARP6 n=1 Tax=Phanerochaete sordida TaxID=48140 RepID=A0A9P3GH38_9APHY|nr:actin family protein [Phanerochaete sordida]
MPPRSRKIVVVDNGASTIKLGVLGAKEREPRIISNAIVRSKGDKATYYGQELDNCVDFSSLHYRLPFEKGYLVDWDAEKAIWDGIFRKEFLGIEPSESSLLITEPYFNLPKLQDVYDQMVFEEYEFEAYFRCAPAYTIPYSGLCRQGNLPDPECMLVIDSGFSYTHVVPIFDGAIIWEATKRLDVGGKLLTNQLKELVSFRQWNMMDETYVINDVKEACCYVSTQFDQDLETCRANARANPIVQEYVLPDFSSNRKGRVRQPEEILEDSHQILYMNNERFTVPEVLFRPDDIGLEQMGLAKTIAHTISLLPEEVQGLFWANIGLTGGSTKFPGFRDRLYQELRTLAPVECTVHIYQSDEPLLDTYRGALACAKQADFAQKTVTRADYAEMGSSAARRKFVGWMRPEGDAPDKGKGRARDEDEDEPVPVKRAPRGRGRGERARATGRGRGRGRGRGAA